MNQLSPATKIEEEPKFFVRDLHATKGSRVHELVDKENSKILHRYTFIDNQTPTAIPVRFAMCLIGNDAFEVADEKGNIIKPRRESTDGTGESINLASDEVIAKLSELTAKALETRVVAAGGTAAKKDEMIAYLIAADGGVGVLSGKRAPDDDAPYEESIDGDDALLDDELEFED